MTTFELEEQTGEDIRAIRRLCFDLVESGELSRKIESGYSVFSIRAASSTSKNKVAQ
jgi:hypothetical protein